MTDEESFEELNAYLDGELPPEERRRVEERLASDPAYHGEMQRLQRAWDLLDRLDRAVVDESFTVTTMRRVANSAAEDLTQQMQELPRRKARARLLISGVALAACGLGYFLGRAIWPDPNERLLRDLPLIENVDLYRQADSIEFLRALDDQGIFAEEVDHADETKPNLAIGPGLRGAGAARLSGGGRFVGSRAGDSPGKS